MTPTNHASDREFLDALATVVEALGASVHDLDESGAPTASDIPVEWNGKVIAHVRPEQLQGTLERMLSSMERDMGVSFMNMDRAQKQRAVRLLDQQGAFMLRGAVEDVAKRMDVSRVTLYSYLNAIRPSP